MKSTLNHTLSTQNEHSRDANIQFFEEGHRYVILTEPDVKYTSVTTWNHQHFPKFDADVIIDKMMNGRGWKKGHKYWGQTPEQIKALWDTNKNAVSGAGTDLHYEIECFNNNDDLAPGYTNKQLYEKYMKDNGDILASKPIEWQYFINFIKDTPDLKPYRTEWIIYNDDVKISGSIDMVYENQDGTISIYDWKRCKNITSANNFNKFAIHPLICHLPDTNFWHYSLQLNTYKVILEEKYGKKVRDLFLVRLHPDAEGKNYDLIKLPDLSFDVKDMFLELRN
ncbi:PD-(D/E)XK nuclease family protein [bacterium]|nr:PD-(D/E)XK nuclease family protein [bacterium]